MMNPELTAGLHELDTQIVKLRRLQRLAAENSFDELAELLAMDVKQALAARAAVIRRATRHRAVPM